MDSKLKIEATDRLSGDEILEIEVHGVALCIPAGIVVGLATGDPFIGALTVFAVICGTIVYAGLITDRYFNEQSTKRRHWNDKKD